MLTLQVLGINPQYPFVPVSEQDAQQFGAVALKGATIDRAFLRQLACCARRGDLDKQRRDDAVRTACSSGSKLGQTFLEDRPERLVGS